MNSCDRRRWTPAVQQIFQIRTNLLLRQSSSVEVGLWNHTKFKLWHVHVHVYRCRRQQTWSHHRAKLESDMNGRDARASPNVQLLHRRDTREEYRCYPSGFATTRCCMRFLVYTSLRSASCVSWQRGTARIRLPHTAAAARLLLSASRVSIDRYLTPTGPTAANAAVACGGRTGQTDTHTDRRTDARQLYRSCFGQCQ